MSSASREDIKGRSYISRKEAEYFGERNKAACVFFVFLVFFFVSLAPNVSRGRNRHSQEDPYFFPVRLTLLSLNNYVTYPIL